MGFIMYICIHMYRVHIIDYQLINEGVDSHTHTQDSHIKIYFDMFGNQLIMEEPLRRIASTQSAVCVLSSSAPHMFASSIHES